MQLTWRQQLIRLIPILIVYLALAFYGIDHQGLWANEFYSLERVYSTIPIWKDGHGFFYFVLLQYAENNLPCYRCIMHEVPGENAERTCADNGILGAVSGVMGSLQTFEVLKEILDMGESLVGKMMIYDALSAKQRLVKLPKGPHSKACGGKE